MTPPPPFSGHFLLTHTPATPLAYDFACNPTDQHESPSIAAYRSSPDFREFQLPALDHYNQYSWLLSDSTWIPSGYIKVTKPMEEPRIQRIQADPDVILGIDSFSRRLALDAGSISYSTSQSMEFLNQGQITSRSCTATGYSNTESNEGGGGEVGRFHADTDSATTESREARVSRYREKRNKRHFAKTIRYASRKAYAEKRPRVKGRFVKSSEAEHQISTPVKRMVVSLASDKAVWDAVMKNDAVRDFRESFYADKNDHPDIQGAGNPRTAMNIVKWLFKKAKEQIIKLIDRVVDILSAPFQPSEKGNEWGNVDAFEVIIRSSFMLSVIVILLVVVAHGDHYS